MSSFENATFASQRPFQRSIDFQESKLFKFHHELFRVKKIISERDVFALFEFFFPFDNNCCFKHPAHQLLASQ